MLSENFLLVHIYHKLQNNYENISYTFLKVYICIPFIISWEIFRKMFLLVHYICAVPHSLLLDFAIKIGVEFCDLSLDCFSFFCLLRSRIIFFQMLFESLPNCCGACDDILFRFYFYLQHILSLKLG